MRDDSAYEVLGLRDNSEVYTIEVLGHCAEAIARELAQSYADRWRHTVALCRVPFVHTESEAWADNQVEVICHLPPTREARA